MEALWVADRRSLSTFVSVQPEYNLLDPTRADVETELAPMCARYGIGMFPYSPLAGGLLTGKYRRGLPLPDSVRASENAEQRFSDQNWQIIDTVVDIAAEIGASPAGVAIGWLRSKPWVTAPIVGANTPEQLSATLDSLDLLLDEKHLARLDEVSAFRRSRPSLEQ